MTVTRRHGVRLAGAPISWGVSEVPGWGVMPDPEQVLSEMESIGLRGTELGPPGFFPPDPRSLLAGAGARMLVLSVVEDEGWSQPTELDDDGWRNLAANVEEIG